MYMYLAYNYLGFPCTCIYDNNNNNNNRAFFDLQVANTPSKLRFEANLSREDSQSTEPSQKPEMISYREDSLSRKSLIK